MQQKFFQDFFSQEAPDFWNNIEKEPQKPRPELKKICMLYIYREYFLYLQSYASGNFLQKCFTFAEQRHKFSQDHKG